MSKGLQAVRGMNDILPGDALRWRESENAIIEVLAAYGYREIRLPIVEQSAVFNRSIGDATDIVQKEMYTFEDRSGDSLTLRPEGTAGCVRAAIQHGFLQRLPQRLWYLGPMFRYERPQRGRLRQFHQIGVEAFGVEGPDIDAEVILMTARLWRELGIGGLRLELNSLGSHDARRNYREVLAGYFHKHRATLDDDSRDRLERNPLRILDSKNPALADIIARAPVLIDYLDEASRDHFDTLQALLADNGVSWDVNPRLVRGLDYYSRTVFEWVTTELGAQGTVCAGGRYDGLVELMGGKPMPAIGFAMGLERLLELRAVQQPAEEVVADVDVYVLATGAEFEREALRLAEELRALDQRWRVLAHAGGGSMKARLKKADRSGAAVALILGEDEYASASVTVKPLRTDEAQERCARTNLVAVLTSQLRR